MKLKFKVNPELVYWGCSAGKFTSDMEHEVDVNEAAVREIIAAEAVGSLYELTDVDGAVTAEMLEVVERQDISEERLAEAMANGQWQEGQLRQFELDKEYAEIEVGSST